VELAVFSLSASSPDGDDSRYLRWHALDHLPQQYEIAGLLHGQRYVSTPACRAARAAASERLAPVNHVVYYLFGGAPPASTLDEFFALRDRLIEVGRFPEWLPNRLVAGCEPVGMHAAPSASVSADVLPFRPARGIYLVVEQDGAWPADAVDALLALDGVAGMWELAPTSIESDELSKSGYGVSIVYLDEDPVEVAPSINALLRGRRPALAAPFVTLQPWEWQEHGSYGRGQS
jgi:hypothetical protein